ncbi:CxxxxCH/CxxCH domain c-type cytochrome [Geotalea toluenoxydans]
MYGTVIRRMTSCLWTLMLLTLLSGTAAASISCYDCHGSRSTHDYRPVDDTYRNITTGGFQGKHRAHLPLTAGPASCSICHRGSQDYTSSHRDGLISLTPNINNSPSPEPALYRNHTSAFRNWTTPFPQTAEPVLGKCTNVNCHFEADTPLWGNPFPQNQPACGNCHGLPPANGSHPATTGSGKKHGDYYGTDENSCSKCHPGHNTFSHATSAGHRPILLQFTTHPNGGGSYSGVMTNINYLPSQNKDRNGTCSGIYCHSNGSPDGRGTVSGTPTWGGSVTCTGCHGGNSDTSSMSPRHDKHAGDYQYQCDKCHSATVTGSTAISDRNRHVDGQKDVALKEGGSFGDSTKQCTNTYCHSNALGRQGFRTPAWNEAGPYKCFYCHKGLTSDSTAANCAEIGGVWDSEHGACTPFVNISTNAHAKHVGPQWIRKYPCSYCHNQTVDATGSIKDMTRHADGSKQVVIDSQWAIDGRPAPSYNSDSKICSNVYCHSDGTANPLDEEVKQPNWPNKGWSRCNACHGHPITGTCNASGCHDGTTHDGRTWAVYTGWTTGSEWRAAMPIFRNEGPGEVRANSHPRHTGTSFTCGNCHTATVVNGDCETCHAGGLPAGNMGEIAHINPAYHVNKISDVLFRAGGSYNRSSKTCSNTRCHTGTSNPQWGASIDSSIICLNCHGTMDTDVDTFTAFNNGTMAKVNLSQWVTTGHGRYSTAGRYPWSNNPAANFPSNPCWYCHDNTVVHGGEENYFRLKKHPQYEQRFDKECAYCHMEHKDYECIQCHVSQTESLAPQATMSGITVKLRTGETRTDWPDHGWLNGCTTTGCHDSDDGLFSSGGHKGHSTGAGTWTTAQKADIKNQYVMMGVCLQCHDDDSVGQCTFCHAPPPSNPGKYSLGYNPGTGFIKPKQARASAAHFGKKHWNSYQTNGVWKGGKFCWDCHDPHGDSNIYMIQSQVATTTDGKYGRPITRAAVSFTQKTRGLDYAGDSTRLCNVCHGPDSKHYLSNFSDGHNSNKICTTCHMHRFADGHADSQPCNSCHSNAKPVPKHVAFGLPVVCVKCHAGSIGNRGDVIGQFNSNSHHVQGVTLTGRQCYACHWEATEFGTIDATYHEGFNFNSYSGVKDAKVDLVVWQKERRPTFYSATSAIQFIANRIATVNEREEVGKLNNHCISCHSDQNNSATPFNDCKTPRQYAWDGQSIASRYQQKGTTTWGKVNSGSWPDANRKDTVVKALSAHGNATANQGGWDAANGYDAAPPNTRASSINVQCYDCHNSHGSKVNGTTTSYVTFNNTRNGGNLKETQNGKGGYATTYMAQKNATGKNAYEAGAGQCFDCHETQNASLTRPWGYQSTFSASQPIMGYDDSPKFGGGTKGRYTRFPYRSKTTVAGTHFSASSLLNYTTHERINGLCTPCHDPHGVSLTMGEQMPYAVPLLKGTWMTNPYKEDAPPPNASGGRATPPNSWGGPPARDYSVPTGWDARRPTVPVLLGWNSDRNAFNTNRINETPKQFAGLCTRCHQQEKLTDGINKNTPWKSRDRIHETVKGWGANTEHSFTCSKCHQPHSSGLPRLMVTNCLDYQHRGRVSSGGKVAATDLSATYGGDVSGGHWGYPIGGSINDKMLPSDAAYKADPYKYEAFTQCHLRRSDIIITPPYPTLVDEFQTVPDQWPQENMWNNVTPWPSSVPPRSYSK